jgi:WS/DGAT/MGAT family acyltransferase
MASVSTLRNSLAAPIHVLRGARGPSPSAARAPLVRLIKRHAAPKFAIMRSIMSAPRQLSAHDASFLYADNSRANANITLVHVYDQRTARGGKVRFKTILAHIASRLDRSRIFRQKLLRLPLEMDYPYWVEDDNFDLEYHVRHVALPDPGDWRQFCIQVSRIHARPLDLDRPLWEIYVIEGLDRFADLPPKSFALIAKVHHAAIDLDSGNEITRLLHDITPEPPEPAPPPPWFPEPAPGMLGLMQLGVLRNMLMPFRMAAPMARLLSGASRAMLTFANEALLHRERMAVTRFNAIVSPHRVFETRRFMLSEFRVVRALVPGATVNDVVLAVCGGGLRRYLEANDELPQASLSAIAPIYTRPEGDQAARPEMSWLRVSLGTDIADPVKRLEKIRAQTGTLDAVRNAVRAEELIDIERHTPAATLALTGKMLALAMRTIGQRTPLANCTVTNVPGPTTPLYLAGARMTYFSAMLPIDDGMGLVFAVTSYDGRVIVSPTGCREQLPDPDVLSQCVRDSFEEYLALARAAHAAPVALKRLPRSVSTSDKRAPRRRSARTAATRPQAAKGDRRRSRARPG